jgi:hypothetical protein
MGKLFDALFFSGRIWNLSICSLRSLAVNALPSLGCLGGYGALTLFDFMTIGAGLFGFLEPVGETTSWMPRIARL